MEIWKPLRNFPSYNGSNEGKIIHVRTQRLSQFRLDPDGRVVVGLMRNGKQYTVKVARVIAETFLGEHPNMDVRHQDLDPTNNRVSNLYWSSRSETIRDAYERGTKKPYQSIAVRVVETGKVYDTIKECAQDTGCDKTQISKHLRGERAYVKGLHFERM